MRIEFFTFKRMMELLESYDNVPNKVIKYLEEKLAEREAEFYGRYGKIWMDFIDSFISDESEPGNDDQNMAQSTPATKTQTPNAEE